MTEAVGIFGGSGFYRFLANVSLVTDYDVGLEGLPDVPAVSAEAAFAVFSENLDRLRALLFRAVPKVGPQPDDLCASALSSAIVH